MTIDDVAAMIANWAADDELIRKAAEDAGLVPTRADIEALCAQADAERDVVAAAKRWHEARQSEPMGSVIDAEVALAATVEALNALTPAGPQDGGS